MVRAKSSPTFIEALFQNVYWTYCDSEDVNINVKLLTLTRHASVTYRAKVSYIQYGCKPNEFITNVLKEPDGVRHSRIHRVYISLMQWLFTTAVQFTVKPNIGLLVS